MIDRRHLILAAMAGIATPALARSAAPEPVALLVPLAGPFVGLGRSLENAARLAEPAGARPALVVIDSGSTPAEAAAAAATATRRGALLVIGPVFAAQVSAVAAVVDARVPILTLSNDASTASSGFVLGITPEQSVDAVLGYARSRGVRRIAVEGDADPWQRAAASAARSSASRLGLEIGSPDAADAVLVTGDAAALVAAARVHAGRQLLGTAADLAGVPLAAIDGAWVAAPDPDAAADFARRFETSHGNSPGQLAALAYDAAGIARTLAASGHLTHDGLLASAGFSGVTGTVRFAADGRATRDMAILLADKGELRTIARGQTA